MLCKLRAAPKWMAYLLTDPLLCIFQLYCRPNLPLSSTGQPLNVSDICSGMPGNKANFISIMGHVGSQTLGKMQSTASGLLVPDQYIFWGPSTTWILLMVVNRSFK